MDLVYRLAIATSRLLFRLLGLRIRVDGAEHLPRSGPAIVVSNHVSFLDFVFVGLAARPSGRFIRFLTRYDVWHKALVGPAMIAMRHVPVDRAAPAGAFLEARAALIRGEIVGVFPEAGISRSFTVRALMPGAVALSRSTGAPVLLVAVWGPQRIATAGLPISLRRGRAVSVAVSPPTTLPTGGSVQDATVELGRQLQELVTGVQQSHPDQPRRGRCDDRHPAHLGGTAPTASDAAVDADVPRTAVHPPDPSAMF